MNWNIFKRQNKTQDKINELTEENTSINLENTRLNNEVKQLRNKHYSLNKEITGLKNEKKTLQSILEEQKKIINKNETIILEKTQKILGLEAEVTHLKEELTNLKEVNQKEDNIFSKYLKQETPSELTDEDVMEYLLTEENTEINNYQQKRSRNKTKTGIFRIHIINKGGYGYKFKQKGQLQHYYNKSLFYLKKEIIEEGLPWIINDRTNALNFIKNYLESTDEEFKKESSQQTKATKTEKEDEVNPHLKNLTPEEVDYLNTNENVIELTNKQKGMLKSNSIGFCWVYFDKTRNRYGYTYSNNNMYKKFLIDLKKWVIKKGLPWMKITNELLKPNLEFKNISKSGDYYMIPVILDKQYNIITHKDKGFVKYMGEQIINYYNETGVVQIYKTRKIKTEYLFKHEVYNKKELEEKYQEYLKFKEHQEKENYFKNLRLKTIKNKDYLQVVTDTPEPILLIESDNPKFIEYYLPILEKEIREKQKLIIHTNKEITDIKQSYIQRDKRTVLTQYYNQLNKKHQFKWGIDKDNAVVCIDEEPTNVTIHRVNEFYNLIINKPKGGAYNYLQGINNHLNHQVIYYIQELVRNNEYSGFYKRALEVAKI